ncbi:hypothetical protein, variant 2 [Aphanomyces astaci]|uniref:Uncharacterized protein n=2 Tax=Aphanomyces astaci TaxID=112090 RepID=W4FFW1_APHAT|nr:hypothetical protein, variant 2 [Aphanomyces astaci]ETV65759.1 hypothetical protein, variant 2 [Aphanomyces astaci]|eukprot:XP_009844738.1 hypothetical protein, variant 2 [Aphanomyces astaci]
MHEQEDELAMEFVKEGCDCHRPVFEPKYLRTHRAGSVKLIRCFPHCCPSHSFASFCTSSIGLTVSSQDVDTVAFLRFQSAATSTLDRGAVISISDVRTSDNVKGEWIPSESRSLLVATTATLFRFNHVHHVGWHYGWMGTSTKAHRTSPHHLVAYVLQRSASSSTTKAAAASDGGRFVVRGVLTSPSFIVMSYRRACYACQKHRNHTASTKCECEGEFNVSSTSAPSPPPPSTSTTSQERPLSSTAIENDLRSILHCVQLTPLGALVRYLPAIESHLARLVLGHNYKVAASLLASLVHASPHRRTCLLLPPSSSHMFVGHQGEQQVDGLVVECVLQALTSAFSNNYRTHFGHYATFLFDKPALIDAYNHWVAWWSSQVTHRLASHSNASLAELARRINKHAASPMLSMSDGVEYFVAQLREVYLGTAGHPSKMPFPPNNALGTMHGLWTFSHVHGGIDLRLPMSLLTVLRCMSMLYVMDIGTAKDECGASVLHVRAPVPLYNTIGSIFVVDGTPRVFRAFPNGESTMTNMSGFIHGDYIANASSPHDAVEVRVFSWPVDAAFAYVTRCRAAVAPGSTQMSLDIQVCRFPVEASLDWSTMTSIERCSHYRRDMEAPVFQGCFVYIPHLEIP